MKRSTERFLTTHTGSLPRPDDLIRMMYAKEEGVPVDPQAAGRMQGRVTVGVRPEAWRMSNREEGGLPIEVTVVEELGADSYVYGTCDVEGTPNNVIVRVDRRDHARKGDVLYVTTDPHHVHVFDSETGERLSA